MAEQDVKSSSSFGIVGAMRILLHVIAIGFLVAPASVWAAYDGADESEASYLFALGQLHRNEGAYEEALDAFKRAVAADPGEPYLRLEFSEFLFQLGRLNDAAEHAEAARRAAPGSPDVLKLLGRGQPVERACLDAAENLCAQAGDAHRVELIEIGAGD